MFPANVTIRDAHETDGRAVERLAALDSAARPLGALVVAEIDRELVAAVPVAGGPAIADPFRPTAEIVHLLELRAAQLRAARRDARRPLRTRLRWVGQLRAAAR